MKYVLVLLCIFGGALLAGCSSSPAENNSIVTVGEPGVMPSPPDPNTIAGNNPRDPKNRKPRPIHPPGPPPQPAEPQPAAENSEVSAMMNEDGSIREFRFFKEHPLINRVEATWSDPTKKDLKVFLKSGKVLTARTDQIPYLHEASSEKILSVVGIRPQR